MAEHETSIVVDAPLEEVYNQWTQFEEFPRFMEGVEEVRQLDDKTLFWRAKIGGAVKEWDADIVDQTPNRRIAWKSRSGAQNAGAVLFAQTDEGTLVTLKLVYEPEGATETVGDALGFVSRRVEGDLHRFKEFIEERQRATGAWRGEIHGREVRKG
jgi:uncharacterized membrane protein